jgi:hypothetical protein
MDNHYLIFEKPEWGHSAVRLLQAPSRYDALKLYVEEEYFPDDVIVNADRTVLFAARKQTFSHLLAFIESECKAQGEFQMRRLSADTWEARFSDVFCGERAPDVETYFDLCRPVFRKEFPRSRAPAFLWYLRDAYLVTFYRRHRRRPIEILKRYIMPHETYPEVLPWDGDCAEILERLWL